MAVEMILRGVRVKAARRDKNKLERIYVDIEDGANEYTFTAENFSLEEFVDYVGVPVNVRLKLGARVFSGDGGSKQVLYIQEHVIEDDVKGLEEALRRAQSRSKKQPV